MDKDNIIGQKIRALRKSKGLTQEQLAERLGIDFKHLSKIELGKHMPTYYVLKKLADVLDFNIYKIEPVSNKKDTVDKLLFKSLQILYSANTKKEKECYLEALQHTRKCLKEDISSKD